MELTDTEMQLAAYIFNKISQDLRNVRKGGRRYWELVSLMQELSEKRGQAQFMPKPEGLIEASDAPATIRKASANPAPARLNSIRGLT